MMSLIAVSTAAGADSAGEAYKKRAAEIRSINDRYNAQANDVEKKYGAALDAHIKSGAPYPDKSADYQQLENARANEARGVEKAYIKENSETRHQRIMELANQLAGKKLPDRLTGWKGKRAQELLKKLMKGEVKPDAAGGPGKGGPGGPGNSAGGGAPIDTGPSKAEVVLDGNGIPKEIEFFPRPKPSPVPPPKGWHPPIRLDPSKSR